MLSYRHAFHAGNHADLLKHSVLALCLDALRKKDKPFFLLDTHAGRGLYDLESTETQKTGEAALGVARIWPQHPAALPERLAATLRSLNGVHTPRRYPGSCWLMADALRPQDRAVFCERHPDEFSRLQENLGSRPGVRALADDGFATTRAVLPPAMGRGLTLIDPSYETDSDYRQVPKIVREMHHRFRAGMILVWYPLLSGSGPLLRALRAIPSAGCDAVEFELSTREEGSRGLFGSGMFVLNPPWMLQDAMRPVLESLTTELDEDGSAHYRIHPPA